VTVSSVTMAMTPVLEISWVVAEMPAILVVV
jgi:hypothetical protein